MTFEVARGTAGRMRELRDRCLLRIVGADDPGGAGEVLGSLWTIAREAAPREFGVSFVSEVIETPDGPMVMMDAKTLDDAELDSVLEGLVRKAEEVGLRSGTLDVPPDGRLGHDLGFVDHAVVGAVLPPPDPTSVRPPESMPDSWRGVAARWLREGGLEPLVAEIISTEAALSWDGLDGYLSSPATRGGFRVSAGTVARGLRTAFGDASNYPRLSFMAARGSMSNDTMTREAEAIRDRIRDCTPELAYAYLTPVSSVRYFGMGEMDVPGAPASYPGGVNRELASLSDIQVLDAFWYQILGPRHLERIGALPGAREIGHGKVELVLGELDDWLDADRAKVVQEYGRSLLAPCFISRDEARSILNERRRRTGRGKGGG